MTGILELTMLALLTSVSQPAANHSILTEYPALSSYQAKSMDEQKIVKLLINYQNSCNAYDPVEVLSLYLPGALIKVGRKGGNSEQIVTIEEYGAEVAENFEERKMYDLVLKFFTPKEVTVNGNAAKLVIPFITYSIPQNYWEKGVFNFEFRKTDAGWLVSKDIREITDLYYIP
jgi:hypothetical protein